MKPNGKKDVKKQAEALGLQWLVTGDDHDWDRVAVFLDAYAGQAEELHPHNIGVYRYAITDRGVEEDEVHDETKRSYYADVKAVAAEIIAELVSGDLDPNDHYFAVDERVRTHPDVFITGKAIATLVFSDNWRAIDEAVNDGLTNLETVHGDVAQYLTEVAFWAMRQDVLDEIDDPFDHLPEDEDEDWDDDDEDDEDWDD